MSEQSGTPGGSQPGAEESAVSEDPRLGEALAEEDLSPGTTAGGETPQQPSRPEERDRAAGQPVEGPPADDDTSPPVTNDPFTG